MLKTKNNTKKPPRTTQNIPARSYTGVGKSRFTVCMEKYMQGVTITIALLTQKTVPHTFTPTLAHPGIQFLDYNASRVSFKIFIMLQVIPNYIC